MTLRDLRIGDWVEYNGSAMQVYGLCGPMPDKDPRYNNAPTVTLWCNGLITVTLDELTAIVNIEEYGTAS